MYVTHEMRWFFPDKLDDDKSLLSSSGLSFEDCATREDSYLLVAGSPHLGIKLREHRIEIKHRVGNAEKIALSTYVTGICEPWVKWSFQVAPDDELARRIEARSLGWLNVKKKLLVIKVVDGSTFIDVTKRARRGCQIDYTCLSINGTIWYTFGLEWFGNESPILDDALCASIFGNNHFSRQSSMSYPQFLLQWTK